MLELRTREWSIFTMITRLFRGSQHPTQVGAGAGGDGGGDRALDERRVRQDGVPDLTVLHHGAGGQDRAAEVGQDEDAGAPLGALDGGGDPVVTGAQTAVVGAAGRTETTGLAGVGTSGARAGARAATRSGSMQIESLRGDPMAFSAAAVSSSL